MTQHASQPKILVIINPKAGKRKTQELIAELEKLKPEIDYQVSEYAGHGYEIAYRELSNYQYFVVAGGDGTVNEVVPALAGTDRIMAVLPVGSGNGFAHESGFTKDIRQLLKDIRREKIIKTDILRLNNRPCIHIAGTGFDSAVVLEFENLRRHGFLNYGISVLKVLLNYRPIEATIQLPTETISGRFFMINIANTGQFGYNVRIVPTANPSDGQFELALVSPFSRWYFPIFSLRLLTGMLKKSKKMRIIPCNSEVIISTKGKDFQVEGEPVQIESPVKISIETGQLNVVDTGRQKF